MIAAGGTSGSITLTGVLAALSDTTRLGLVRVLADGREWAWGDLRVPLAKSTLSHHLKVLRNAGVTETRREGTRRFVRLRASELEESLPGLLDSVLAAAARTGTGDGVVAHCAGAQSSPATPLPGQGVVHVCEETTARRRGRSR